MMMNETSVDMLNQLRKNLDLCKGQDNYKDPCSTRLTLNLQIVCQELALSYNC